MSVRSRAKTPHPEEAARTSLHPALGRIHPRQLRATGCWPGQYPCSLWSSNPHPLAVSSVVAADSLPWLLLALPAGAFADRFERGPLMAIPNMLRARPIAVGAFLILSDRINLATLIVVVLINASGRAIYYSSLQAIVPEIVHSDALEYTNGVMVGTETGTEYLAGPVVGTWFFAMSKAIPFFADAIAMVLSCIPFVGFRSKAPNPMGSRPPSGRAPGSSSLTAACGYLILMVASLAGLQGMESGILVLLATTVWGVERAPTGSSWPPAPREPHGQPGSQPAGQAIRSAQTLIGAASSPAWATW